MKTERDLTSTPLATSGHQVRRIFQFNYYKKFSQIKEKYCSDVFRLNGLK